MFQFPQPKRAATLCNRWSVLKLLFQFTQPKRAATCRRFLFRTRPPCFNSRSPSGLRLSSFLMPADLCWVSIHAAQAGCDSLCSHLVSSEASFNSRSPSGLRQWNQKNYKLFLVFQFTQPKRAATVAAKIQQKRDSLKG